MTMTRARENAALDLEGLISEKGDVNRELWQNNCRNNYDDAIACIASLGKTNEWRNLAKSIERRSEGCLCPVCYADAGEKRKLSIDMAFPPAPPWVYDPEDPLEDMGLCMSCKDCGHKTYVEFHKASEEDLADHTKSLETARNAQKKHRKKRRMTRKKRRR